jgi:copper chaperone NosL
MRNVRISILFAFALIIFLLSGISYSSAEAETAPAPVPVIGPMPVTAEMKCHTCGMRVFEFTNWHTQIVYNDNKNDAFCAVKCLMAYYFEPVKYTDSRTQKDFKALYAKDYYTLEWRDMKKMYFVLGSDVLGPMGKDLVPFANRESAETFLKDHNGSRILAFDEITLDLIQKLRMKKGKGL